MIYDLAIIGGGINGAAIAADAAGRGLSVFLCEKNDVASGTSSSSSKLIHGGLRYLEFFDFKLVRESLQERKILLRRAPHLVYPLSFVMPDNKHSHSPFVIRLGLFLYDFLAHDNQVPHSKRINLAELPFPSHLKKQTKGFNYTDCWGDDARLVIANLQLAKENGAVIATRMELLETEQTNSSWQLRFEHGDIVQAKCLINAAGPWVDQVKARILKIDTPSNLHLVKGSHIVVKRFYEGDHAFILQNDDGRIIFIIPFEKDKLIIGTTDVLYKGSLDSVSIDADEINYLKKAVEKYFDNKILDENILWTYSGVRSLYDGTHGKKPLKMSRDYFIELIENNTLPLVTVYGGKLTTHRRLAESVLKKLKKYFPQMSGNWTENTLLPGGDIYPSSMTLQLGASVLSQGVYTETHEDGEQSKNNNAAESCLGGISHYQQFVGVCQHTYPWVPLSMLKRLVKTYGSKINLVLGDAKGLDGLGRCFGADLFETEVNYLINNEWAKTADDILWRRTKLGLYFTKLQIEELDEYTQDTSKC